LHPRICVNPAALPNHRNLSPPPSLLGAAQGDAWLTRMEADRSDGGWRRRGRGGLVRRRGGPVRSSDPLHRRCAVEEDRPMARGGFVKAGELLDPCAARWGSCWITASTRLSSVGTSRLLWKHTSRGARCRVCDLRCGTIGHAGLYMAMTMIAPSTGRRPSSQRRAPEEDAAAGHGRASSCSCMLRRFFWGR
jgi:hypothetical protein